jgi:hypothetical protein
VFWLPLSSVKYGSGISFSARFCRLVAVIKIAGLLLFVVCTCFISYYIWTRARASSRFIFSEVLSLGRIIAKMTLSDSFLFKAFRGFLDWGFF